VEIVYGGSGSVQEWGFLHQQDVCVCVWYGGLHNLESCGGLASVVLQEAGRRASCVSLFWCVIHSAMFWLSCGGVPWLALGAFRALRVGQFRSREWWSPVVPHRLQLSTV